MFQIFDINVATKYGIEEAILIDHFQHWIEFEQRHKRNFHDGRTWTCRTLDEIANDIHFLNKSKVSYTIERLCNGKGCKSKKDTLDFEPILMKGDYNKSAFAHTVWYAFVDEKEWIRDWGLRPGHPLLSLK